MMNSFLHALFEKHGKQEWGGIMTLIKNHFEANFDQELLKEFIKLYNISAFIDPNRKITGVDIFRNYEYSFPLIWLRRILSSESKVLDIGSSSTIWPTMLYFLFKCNIYATDIDLTHLETQKHYLYNIGALDKLGNQFVFEYQDATLMDYQDNFFDVVCSISALEHIPGDGDIKAVKEIERVLKLGGFFVLTAPFNVAFSESTTDHYHFGYEKRYDLNSIKTRFSAANKLICKELLFIDGMHNETDEISDFWYKHRLYNSLGKISMLFSMLMYNVSSIPSNNTRGFLALYQKQ